LKSTKLKLSEFGKKEVSINGNKILESMPQILARRIK